VMYPQSKFCFLVIGASALLACFFIQYLPQGDPLMGRGFVGKVAMDEHGLIQPLKSDEESNVKVALTEKTDDETPQAVSYREIFGDSKSIILCLTGFLFQ
jgi:hypothetical protein